MKKTIATIALTAAIATGAALVSATPAAAQSFGFSIGGPGYGFSYNSGYPYYGYPYYGYPYYYGPTYYYGRPYYYGRSYYGRPAYRGSYRGGRRR